MEFRYKAMKSQSVCLTCLALRFIAWYSARVLARVKDGETLDERFSLYGCGTSVISSVLAWEVIQ